MGNSNKKEREEIEGLRKELQRVAEEAKAKEAKQKTTIERLKKQVEDLAQKNKEQTEELRHLTEIVRQGSTKKDQAKGAATGIGQGANRYTFSAKQEEQPKGILKNKNESLAQS